MTYLEFQFTIYPLQPASDILIAELSEIGFESFVEQESGLIAYISEANIDKNSLANLYILSSTEFKIDWTSKLVKQQNWNAEWEKGFKPIIVDNRCMVRGPFHQKSDSDYDIVIEPKMSFGTGHHETTYMMLSHILDNDFNGKTVLDMGCGTGVLAILAEMRGASYIEAIDIDNWCYLNSVENIERNGSNKIKVFEGNSSLLSRRKYDIILANINRNTLLEDIPIYASCLDRNAFLFLSGFYLSDLDMISKKCSAHNLQFEKKLEKNNWVAAKYVF
ncbi:50S ribosomal protein L11 methyltransferase [Croceitalea rosinachiae]|uniref:Ribosomal protein L11 methyltransferase n=1 Tax=Croceitalea rosinachiae TaxID=3075596 RepID=A0ABU3ADY9_9FLAO|nr:50S ribosomal protein L11 methyltransferase [Croceitalea sp. F388]MDT0608115.1 50S ribosomal protein L11 methyltransferase [Croceitalea sp. F388]